MKDDSQRTVRTRRGDIDVERSSLGVVIQAEAVSRARCPVCKCPQFLGDHRWDCPEHERHGQQGGGK